MKFRNLLWRSGWVFILFLLSTLSQGQTKPVCVEDATIFLRNNSTPTINCVGDDLPNQFEVRTDDVSTPYVVVITDEDNNILEVSYRLTIDTEPLGEGVFRVWMVHFIGELLAEPGMNAATDELSSGCFSLSTNFLTVENVQPDGGSVSTTEGEGALFTCPDDDASDVVTFTTTSEDPFYQYVLTDASGTVLELLEADTYDFGPAAPGTRRVYGFSFIGDVTLQPGDNLLDSPLASGCGSLSEDFVEITTASADGGVVTLTNGGEQTEICEVGDADNTVSFQRNTDSPLPYAFLVTNAENIIIDIVLASGTYDFSSVVPGDYRIWGLSYSGDLLAEAGNDVAGTPLSDRCFDLSDNFISVLKRAIDGGAITLSDSTGQAEFCALDGTTDIFQLEAAVNTEDQNYAFVVTDTANQILQISESATIDADGLGAGAFRVWGIGYSGNLLLQPGDVLGSVAASDECFEQSGNFVSLTGISVNGGSIAIRESGEAALICLIDPAQSDTISLTTSNTAGPNQAFLVTDTNNIIVRISDTPEVDLSGLPLGTNRIWTVAYSGQLLAEGGQDAGTAALSDECSDLSDNFVTVTRSFVDGQEVRLASESTDTLVCSEDGEADNLQFTNNTKATDANYAYLITNENNVLLTALTQSNVFDFDVAPAGVCRVWGVSYTGLLIIQPGQNAVTANLSDACFDLSDNFVTVAKDQIEGGTVSFADGRVDTITCGGDGDPDVLELASTGLTPGANFTYLVTNEDNVIIGNIDTDTFNFEQTVPDAYRIWGLAYTGNLTFIPGDTAGVQSLSSDCFTLSDNFISLNVVLPEAGAIRINSGQDSILCNGDGQPDLISFEVEGQTAILPYQLLITDTAGTILAIVDSFDNINLEPLGSDDLLVYGLSYNGMPTAEVGQDIQAGALATECFDLTGSPVTIVRQTVNGGRIAFTEDPQFQSDTLFVCEGDGQDDVISFFAEGGGPDGDYRFVLTNPNGVILKVLENDTENFETLGLDESIIYGVSFTGSFDPNLGGLIENADFSDACFTLSENTIRVIRDQPDGGTVSSSGLDSVALCVSPGASQVAFSTTSAAAVGYAYILTDGGGQILEVTTGSGFDFAERPLGNYRSYGLSYTLDLVAANAIGESIDTAVLASGCFELSDNFVRIQRFETTDGGQLFTPMGDTLLYTCPGDSVPDAFAFLEETTATNANYRLMITDENNSVIVPDIEGNVINFERAEPGVLRVWGVSFTGELMVGFGDNILSAMLSDSCFDLSANFITVVVGVPEGGTVNTIDGATEISFILGDTLPDTAGFIAENNSNSPYQYIVTDQNNTIVSVADSDQITFDTLGAGSYRVWGVAYTGSFTGQIGDDAASVSLSSDCFDLSDNFVQVNISDNMPAFRSGEQQSALPIVTVRDRSLLQLEVAPNPVVNRLRVQVNLPDAEAESFIEVFDFAGRQLVQQHLGYLKGFFQTEIDVSQYQQGIYLIRIHNGDKIRMAKFIKELP